MSITRIALILIGCVLALSIGPLGHAGEAPESPAGKPDTAAEDNPVYAKINGHPLRQSDIGTLYEQLRSIGRIPEDAPDVKTFLTTGKPRLRKQLIEMAIDREQTRQYVLSSSIVVEEAEIDAEWKTWQDRLTQIAVAGEFADKHELTPDLKKAVARQFVRGHDLAPPERETAVTQLLANATFASPEQGTTVEQFLKKRQITDAERKAAVEQFYKKHHITGPEYLEILTIDLKLKKITDARLDKEALEAIAHEVRASHILLKTGGEETDDEVKEKTLFVKKEIEGGRSFEECAKAYSQGPSGPRGGDLGFFPRYGAMLEPFAAAAYALKEGEVSDPVRTKYGYHLITVTERKESSEETKKRMKNRLLNEEYKEIKREIKETVEIERLYTIEENESKATEAPKTSK